MIDDYYADGGVIASDPLNNNVFWTGGANLYMTVSKTTDQGTTWTRYTLTADSGYAYAIALEPGNSNTVYAGGRGGLFRTTNAGALWSDISSGVTGAVSAIAIDPVTTDNLYAGTEYGVYRSTNAGASWSNTGCTDVNALLIIPEYPDSIFAGTNSGVYLSTDCGNSWMPMNEGLTELEVTCLGSDRVLYLFASTMGAGMFRQDIESAIEEADECCHSSIASALPNPARASITIDYELVQRSNVGISIYDCAGRLVKGLVHETKCAGEHVATWDLKDDNGSKVPAGIYFCRLRTDAVGDCYKLTVVH